MAGDSGRVKGSGMDARHDVGVTLGRVGGSKAEVSDALRSGSKVQDRACVGWEEQRR